MARRTEEGARLAGEAEDRRKWREGWQRWIERQEQEAEEQRRQEAAGATC